LRSSTTGPGVTRDRRYAAGRLGDLELELIDTAGFEDVDDESLESRMRIQTERAVDEADVVLSSSTPARGLTPLDRIFANSPQARQAGRLAGEQGEAARGSRRREAFALGWRPS
jgi:GTP-binding protein